MKTLIIMQRLHGLNEYINAERTNKHIAANMKKSDMEIVQRYAKITLKGWKATTPVRMHYRWYEPNKKRDKDNISSYGRKIIQDALVVGGYLENDGWKQIVGFDDAFFVDKQNPRIEVDIEEREET